jgi:hypothetical protein
MINESTRVVDVTIGQLKEYLGNAPKDEDITVSTKELADILKCNEARVNKYGRLGMKKHRLKKDCWYKYACLKWVKEELPKVYKELDLNL